MKSLELKVIALYLALLPALIVLHVQGSQSINMARVLLITGATGKQGGAVIKSLQGNAEFEILAVTRNPDSPSAQKLSQGASNITLVKGDFNDVPTLFANAKRAASGPIWGVYSVQVGYTTDIASEERVLSRCRIQ